MFTKKQITESKRVCLRLSEAREAKGISQTEMSRRLRLSVDYIVALEECRFDDLPFARVYQKNIIKKYLQVLGVESKNYLDQFIYEEVKASESVNVTLSTKTDSPAKNWNIPLLSRIFGVFVVLLLFGGYFSLQVKRIIDPPSLVLHSPDTESPVYDRSVIIKGQTDKEAQVFINGKAVMSNEEGSFEESLSLENGVNEVIVSAKKKHGKVSQETRYIMVRDEDQLSLERRTFVP